MLRLPVSLRARTAAVVAAASALGVVLLSSGCGVPLDDRARAADPADVPYGLVAQPTSTTVDETGPERATVYLVREDRLVPVTREVDGQLDASSLVEELATGLTAEEQSEGLRRAFGGSDLVAGVSQAGTLCTIELSPEFERLPSREQVLALGQIVFTVTGLQGLEQVSFTLDGEPLDVPTGDATLTNRPVSRSDFGELLGSA
jgi:spore germination protein GerM